MPDDTSQDKDFTEDEISEVNVLTHSEEATEEKGQENEEEEEEEEGEEGDTAPPSHPPQLVRSWETLSISCRPPPCRLHSIHLRSHVPQPPPSNPISG